MISTPTIVVVVIAVTGGARRRGVAIICTLMDAAIDSGDAHRRERVAKARVLPYQPTMTAPS